MRERRRWPPAGLATGAKPWRGGVGPAFWGHTATPDADTLDRGARSGDCGAHPGCRFRQCAGWPPGVETGGRVQPPVQPQVPSGHTPPAGHDSSPELARPSVAGPRDRWPIPHGSQTSRRVRPGYPRRIVEETRLCGAFRSRPEDAPQAHNSRCPTLRLAHLRHWPRRSLPR